MGDNNIKMSFQSNATKYFPKILCVGKNYLKHVMQMGGTEVPTTPLIFTKPWSTLAFNPKLLSLPSTKVHQIDHELQLGVYINKAGKNITKEQAFSYIGGYFIGIDFSDRDFQKQAKSKGIPWSLAKEQDNFCPISDLIPKQIDPYQVELELIVNGQTKQKDSAGKMHFKIDDIISYISKYYTLGQGDLILTGTPDGVGPVKSGDKVHAFGRIGDRVVAKLQFQVSE